MRSKGKMDESEEHEIYIDPLKERFEKIFEDSDRHTQEINDLKAKLVDNTLSVLDQVSALQNRVAHVERVIAREALVDWMRWAIHGLLEGQRPYVTQLS